jgi:hypothetical protein
LSENTDASLNKALQTIFYLAALHFLDKYLVVFFQGGYFNNNDNGDVTSLIRDTIIYLCGEMKYDCVSLVDSLAPPDHVINSALGDATGNVYKKLFNNMTQSAGSLQRIHYLDDYLDKSIYSSLKSKL